MRSLLSKNDMNEEAGIIETARKCLIKNEDVQFYWSMISSNWEDKESSTLLSMIVDVWIKVRGYSHTASIMELYKRKTKKAVQKSKGLRKNLQTNS